MAIYVCGSTRAAMAITRAGIFPETIRPTTVVVAVCIRTLRVWQDKCPSDAGAQDIEAVKQRLRDQHAEQEQGGEQCASLRFYVEAGIVLQEFYPSVESQV